MFKAVLMWKCLSIGASTSVTTLWPFREPTWTPVSLSAKTAGSGVTLHFHAESKMPNVLNAMSLTNLNIIENSVGAAKQTPSSTHQGWKSRKANYALTCSSAWTVAGITKLTPISVHFGDISSIGNGTRGSMLRSMKTDRNQFVWTWTALPTNNY